MFLVLLKKQLKEFNIWLFVNKGKTKKRSKKSFITCILLFAFIMLFLSGMFFGLGYLLCEPLVNANLTWFYFLYVVLIALILGVIGSVFNTYSTLYKAKDNELLLSMPIKPSLIISVRMLMVYLIGLLYETCVFAPMLIVFYIWGSPTFKSVIGSLILYVVVSIIILILSCVLGYVVAIVNTKLKSKALVSVFVSLLMLGIFYYYYFKIINNLDSLITNAILFGNNFKGKLYPIYMLGRVGEGDIVSILVYLFSTLALFVLTYYVMSKTFIKLATTKAGEKSKKTNIKIEKSNSVYKTLIKRELKHFLSLQTYMLNCSLGTLFFIVGAVFVFIKGGDFANMARTFELEKYLGVLVIASVCVLASMNDITSPSISLEGKNLWIVKSLPVEPIKVLNSKIILHLILTSLPVFVFSLSCIIVLELDLWFSILTIITPQIFVLFCAISGLIANLKLPNLNYNSETLVCKQSMPVFIATFGNWALIGASVLVGYLVRNYISLLLFATLFTIVLLIATCLLYSWLYKKGTKIFSNL